jgi:hypothetical protein
LSSRTSSGRALALAPQLRDLRTELRDLVAELVVLALQLRGGLDERRPLLGRVPDSRALGRELGGDEEAQREQREARA